LTNVDVWATRCILRPLEDAANRVQIAICVHDAEPAG
jgi:hypothetical protein